jgi:hypothetical protein
MIFPPLPMELRIICHCLLLFEKFHVNHCSFLVVWQCGDFTAREFHRRCDGHANTFIWIFDTNTNIVGDFTPVEWESYGEKCKDDNSLQIFVFTLKNLHGIHPVVEICSENRKEVIRNLLPFCMVCGIWL